MKKNRLLLMAVSTGLSLMMIGSNMVTVAAKNKTRINSSDFKKVESFRFSDSGEGSSTENTTPLPSKVDLRQKGVVTPVKFQNPFGTCWAFGAIAASETSILSEMGKTYEETHLDLSEKHLAWFLANPLEDPYSSQNGEGLYQHTAVSSSAKYNFGGMRFYASSMFSQGVGPVLEADYPYQGKNGLIQRRLDDDGNLVNLCYSDKDDWSINSKERFQRKYRLEDSIIIGKIFEEVDEEIQYDDRILQAVKEQLYKGRGVAVGYCADQSKPNEEGNSTYMNYTNWCQYTDEVTPANHEVCIVGYDDNYPKERFNEDHQPPENGAFLVKNSWGSGESEFPNKGDGRWGIIKNDVNTGYFWLSYYDLSIEDFEIFDFDINSNSNETEIIDQYDFASYNGANTVESKKDCDMANVYTAQYNQELRAVSCVTSSPDTQVYYEVHLIDDSREDSIYSTPVAYESENYEYGGYHLKTLSSPVRLSKGQKYSIQVKLVNNEGANEIIIPLLMYDNDSSIGQTNIYSRTIVNEDESLLKYNGEWYDWKYVKETFNPVANYTMEADNFPIKGYSVLLENTDLSQKQIVLSKNSFDYDGIAKKPDVTVDGLTEGKDYTVSYLNNVSPGTGKVVVEGKGLFTGSATQYFSIVKKNDTPTTSTQKATTSTQKATTKTSNKTTQASKKTTKVKLPASVKIRKLQRGKKYIQVLWKKQSGIKGYQIQYSLKKNMKSAKLITVKSAVVTKKKISKLKAKRYYYVRMRSYKKANGRNYYSKWSGIKKIKTK